uniref:Peptidase M12B domain-containing protein n=1 Tax=Clastoptera arizonana TaxID=38151 RepID=A0A1B6CIH1_9HEMI
MKHCGDILHLCINKNKYINKFDSMICLFYIIIISFLLKINRTSKYVLCLNVTNNKGKIHGRYSRDITDFTVVVPAKIFPNGSFYTFKLPHYYSNQLRKKRSTQEDSVHYKIALNGRSFHLRLEPNIKLTSPGLVIEKRSSGNNLSQIHIFRPQKHLCHYTGKIKGLDKSRIALSGCDGLVGYIKTEDELFYIEPKHGEEPAENGEQVHIVYKRSAQFHGPTVSNCAVKGLENWWNAWSTNIAQVHAKVKRSDSGTVKNRYIECLVVADLKFLNHNKNIDVEEYILTVMNIVSDYYHDASVGNMIDVVVVKIIYLEKEKEEIDLEISQDATKTLASFCDWQVTINPKDHSHPNHHDLAILLTRYDLCTDPGSCSLLGLAYVGSVCTTNRNCIINEDNGLILGVVIAHEIGHTLGCAHDSPEESGCLSKSEDDSNTVMSPNVLFYTNNWSNCSREFITHLFDNQLGECLLDEPKDHNYPLPDMPSGAVYGADEQCKFIFGNDYISADVGGGKFCEQLWCKVPSDTNAITNGDPAADGTKCGPDKWCYEEECVGVGVRPASVNGEWGAWEPWTQCSRSCGGGITMRERLCNNPQPSHRGRYCLGKNREYEICNTESCDDNLPGFRDIQCTEFNSKSFQGVTHIWSYYKPPDTDPNPCALYCINEENTFMKLAPRVKDGTRCQLGTKDTCIQGSCMHVGCDWKINSKMVEDVCGICGGDGTHCNLTRGLFNAPGTPGYVEFLTIPEGGTNIKIQESSPSENMIAASAIDKKTYYLNSDYIETEQEKVKFGSVSGIYSKPEPEREEIYIKGPTKEPLVFYVAFVNPNNPGYKYSFALLTNEQMYSPKYHWEYVKWDKCSVRCGGGTEISKSNCIEERDGRVNDDFCDMKEKPEPKSRLCNMYPCKTRWKVWKWGPCSGCIFKSGIRHRQVECVKENPNLEENDEIITKAEDCCNDPPKNTELCNSPKPCPKFRDIKIRKRSSLCDVPTGNVSTGIVQDPIAPDTVCLKVAPISECRVKNFTEQQQEETDGVPRVVISGPIQEFHSVEAIKKMKEIHQGHIMKAEEYSNHSKSNHSVKINQTMNNNETMKENQTTIQP